MSAYLLDSCALLWWMADAPKLGRQARRAIANQRNEIIVSAASLWEISIKSRRGRLTGVDDYLTVVKGLTRSAGIDRRGGRSIRSVFLLSHAHAHART